MSMVYVSHCYGGNADNLRRVKKILHDLQIENPQDCFISPLIAFSYIRYGEFALDQQMAIHLDLLSVCDTLIVASDMNDCVQMEVDFANLVGMEVIWLD